MTENQPTIAEPVDQTAPSAGSPETPGAESPSGSTSGPSYGTPPPYAAPPQQRLRRSRNDRVLAGVCGGLAENLGIDATLLRILLVVGTVFTGGALLIAYVIAWALMPDTPAYVVPLAPVAPQPGAPASFAAGGTGTYVDPGTGQVYGAPAPVAQPRTEPRSYLGLFALSGAILVGGVFALVSAAGGSVPGVVVAATMLLVVGAGLLVGAFRGRARWLIVPAIVLLLVTQGAAAASRYAGNFDGSTGDVTWVPTSSSESFELGAGSARLDLGSLPTGDVDLDVSMGAGELIVIVPADMQVEIDSTIGAGEIRVPGERPQSGIGLDSSRTVTPVGGTTATTTVSLTSNIGLGTLEVRREAS